MGPPGPSVDAPALSLPLGLTLTLPVRGFPKPVQKERLLTERLVVQAHPGT